MQSRYVRQRVEMHAVKWRFPHRRQRFQALFSIIPKWQSALQFPGRRTKDTHGEIWEGDNEMENLQWNSPVGTPNEETCSPPPSHYTCEASTEHLALYLSWDPHRVKRPRAVDRDLISCQKWKGQKGLWTNSTLKDPLSPSNFQRKEFLTIAQRGGD